MLLILRVQSAAHRSASEYCIANRERRAPLTQTNASVLSRCNVWLARVPCETASYMVGDDRRFQSSCERSVFGRHQRRCCRITNEQTKIGNNLWRWTLTLLLYRDAERTIQDRLMQKEAILFSLKDPIVLGTAKKIKRNGITCCGKFASAPTDSSRNIRQGIPDCIDWFVTSEIDGKHQTWFDPRYHEAQNSCRVPLFICQGNEP